MMRKHWPVVALCLILFGNIACTQYVVHTYDYEKYELTIALAVLNLLLFPISIAIYKKGTKT